MSVAATPQIRWRDAPALRVFTLLGPVAPRSGGTIFVAGSHRLSLALAGEAGGKLHSADVRRMLRAESDWFDVLWTPDAADREEGLPAGAIVRGVPVRLEGICGQAGDVVVMHPNTLHAAAPNAADQPRMMLTQTLVPRA
jgi:ectoine hydroxylase-related dioxygenase (phytanoyl-CoA dioxygenase family)